MEIVVIGDCDAVVGFKLAGLRKAYVAGQTMPDLEKLMKEDSVGLIIVGEHWAEQNREALNKLEGAKKKIFPIVVEIPDRTGPIAEKKDPLGRSVKRAIGVEIL